MKSAPRETTLAQAHRIRVNSILIYQEAVIMAESAATHEIIRSHLNTQRLSVSAAPASQMAR